MSPAVEAKGLPAFAEVAEGYAARFPLPPAAPGQARSGLLLRLEELSLAVRSNNPAVVADLREYFGGFASDLPEDAGADLSFLLLDAPAQEPPVALAARPHLPGKRPDKERFADLPGNGAAGRIVRKQATSMLFLFGGGRNIALGPCLANRNQLVNFLCSRYMERRLAQGWVLGHAAGVARGDRALALFGFAGMGKSTLALHLVARGLDFVSNDRVLVGPSGPGPGGPVLHGIPKHPRLNPGTALGNPELAPLLSCALPERLRAAYADYSSDALFAVEDKFDARIDECFGQCVGPPGGPSRFRLSAPLAGVVALNWKHGAGPCHARRVQLAERPDLVEALRKPPGVFYLPEALAAARLTAAECLESLRGVPALELTGGADFPAGATACLELLESQGA